jgi:hypothetical protein
MRNFVFHFLDLTTLLPNYTVCVHGGDMTSPKFRKQLVRDLAVLSQEVCSAPRGWTSSLETEMSYL